MKFLHTLLIFLIITTNSYAQNVGIGTNSPKAGLHVADSSVVFSAAGLSSNGNLPISGMGRRLLWYAPKAAFRVGGVTGTQWNDDSIGNYSVAAGWDAMARGYYSIALGGQVSASGHSAVALGLTSLASGERSVSLGVYNHAKGYASVTLGSNDTASGDYALALGYNNKASGIKSTVFGTNNIASGPFSFACGSVSEASGNHCFAAGSQAKASGNLAQAIGYKVMASGDFSMALGSSASSNGYTGSFVLGDHSSNDMLWSSAPNSYHARFAGGYKLYSNAALTIGSYLGPNQNAWSTISSVHLKENFKAVDGESFLQKISAMQLTSWNYKGQDKATLRHYGPMAQDFYAAFGNDGIGTIGEETSINQADFDGVNLVAIQALEKRTASQAATILALQQQVEMLVKELEGMRGK